MAVKLSDALVPKPNASFAVIRIPVGANGSPDIAIAATQLSSSAKGPRIAIVNGLHGEERTGALLIQNLLARELSFSGELVVIPFANSTAAAMNVRLTPEDGVDLNRVFPGDAQGSLSHRIADALFTFLQGFDLVIDIHSFPKMRMPCIGVFCDRGTTEQKRRVLGLISHMRPDYIWRLDTSAGEIAKAGSLVEALLGQGILSFGVEVPDIELISAKLEQRSTDGLQRVIERFAASPLPNKARTVPAIARVPTTSSHGGLFIRRLDVHAKVTKGDVVGDIVLLDTFEKVPVRTPIDGVVLCILEKTIVSTDQRVAIIGEMSEVVI